MSAPEPFPLVAPPSEHPFARCLTLPDAPG